LLILRTSYGLVNITFGTTWQGFLPAFHYEYVEHEYWNTAAGECIQFRSVDPWG
jgi:hypothetical protein